MTFEYSREDALEAAERCEALADAAVDPDEQNTYRRLAMVWRDVAVAIERGGRWNI